MASEISKLYEIDGVTYNIVGNRKLHKRMEEDEEFAIKYIQENKFNVEVELGNDSSYHSSDLIEFIWTKDSTMLLINEYQKRKDFFRNPKCKKKLLWYDISKAITDHGCIKIRTQLPPATNPTPCRLRYAVSADICDRKFRNMKGTYVRIKDNKKYSGPGAVSWEYYELFEDIFSQDKEEKNGTRMSTSISKRLDKAETSEEEATHLSSEEFVSRRFGSQKHAKYRRLELHRNHILEIENKKLKELRSLREAVEKSNLLQEERNKILHQKNQLLAKIVNKIVT